MQRKNNPDYYVDIQYPSLFPDLDPDNYAMLTPAELIRLPERLYLRRTTKGLTQREMAEVIMRTHQAYAKIEAGKTSNISTEFLFKLAHRLDCQPDYLIGRVSHPDGVLKDVQELISPFQYIPDPHSDEDEKYGDCGVERITAMDVAFDFMRRDRELYDALLFFHYIMDSKKGKMVRNSIVNTINLAKNR